LRLSTRARGLRECYDTIAGIRRIDGLRSGAVWLSQILIPLRWRCQRGEVFRLRRFVWIQGRRNGALRWRLLVGARHDCAAGDCDA